ncbi:hypothetical protein PMAG_a1567 [Pseudoalteromonas mariniglutinosa NCIMB 1770]|nr:hypothetical protein [Pseudoalteromonas mariniglutinosa NCIMB 1770]
MLSIIKTSLMYGNVVHYSLKNISSHLKGFAQSEEIKTFDNAFL